MLANHLGLLLQNHEYTFPNTVTEIISNGAYAKNGGKPGTIVDILKALQLSDLAKKSVLQLSGGEKRLVDFATLLLQAPQYYLLDEPTNHLDMDSAGHLIHGLNIYEGSMLFVSHYRNFIDSICTHIFAIDRNGSTGLFEGKISDYLDRQYETEKDVELSAIAAHLYPDNPSEFIDFVQDEDIEVSGNFRLSKKSDYFMFHRSRVSGLGFKLEFEKNLIKQGKIIREDNDIVIKDLPADILDREFDL